MNRNVKHASWLQELIDKSDIKDSHFWDNCRLGYDGIYKLPLGFHFFLQESGNLQSPDIRLDALETVVCNDDFWKNLLTAPRNSVEGVEARHLIQVYNQASVLFDIWKNSPIWMRDKLLLEPKKYRTFMYELKLEDAVKKKKIGDAQSLASERASTPLKGSITPQTPAPHRGSVSRGSKRGHRFRGTG